MTERITPRMLVDHVLSVRGMRPADLNVAPLVVISWQPAVVRSLARAIGAGDPANFMRFALYTGEIGGRDISVAGVPLGAPVTVKCMEEIISCGARAFVGLGRAGSLQPTTPVGSFVIPTSCIIEEGTSAHYSLGDGLEPAPDPKLVETIMSCCRAEGVEPVLGPLWTTDAIYREMIGTIKAYRSQGVVGVDMETSAMYVLGKFRGVAVCNLLLVSDELWHEWNPAFGSLELAGATAVAERIMLNCLPEIGALIEHGEPA